MLHFSFKASASGQRPTAIVRGAFPASPEPEVYPSAPLMQTEEPRGRN